MKAWMISCLLGCMIVFGMCSESSAFGRRRGYSNSYSTGGLLSTDSTTTAQGVANIMARLRRVGHWGGNPGYEGCGYGATQALAYNICCYANSEMTTVDVGYAQDASGNWYCCRRYK